MDIHDLLLLEGRHGFFAEIGSPCLSFTDADVYCNRAHIGHLLETYLAWLVFREDVYQRILEYQTLPPG